jgi:hypothetical protein
MSCSCECSNISFSPTYFRCSLLYQLFNRIVALFKLTIRNNPESTITGRMITKGRVEHHFLAKPGNVKDMVDEYFETDKEGLKAVWYMLRFW